MSANADVELAKPDTATVERFMRYVIPEPNTGCWLWIGWGNAYGYGGFSSRKTPYSGAAHRASYEMFRGPIAEGLVIDHLCRVPCCVNPDHLEVVTQAENVARGLSAKGNPKTQQMKERLSRSLKGRPPSESLRRAVSISNATRPCSEETREKLRVASKKSAFKRWGWVPAQT